MDNVIKSLDNPHYSQTQTDRHNLRLQILNLLKSKNVDILGRYQTGYNKFSSWSLSLIIDKYLSKPFSRELAYNMCLYVNDWTIEYLKGKIQNYDDYIQGRKYNYNQSYKNRFRTEKVFCESVLDMLLH